MARAAEGAGVDGARERRRAQEIINNLQARDAELLAKDARGTVDGPCVCGDCVRANHGQPAVVFEDTQYRRGYELHGTYARDYWAARDKAKADLEALKMKLRGHL